MARLIVRDLEKDVMSRVQARARRRGRSIEEEVRDILHRAVRDDGAEPGLGTRMAARFAGIGVTLDLVEPSLRNPRPADLSDG